MLPKTFVAGWLFIQEGCGNTYVYDASHREYAWTGFQVNREVITMLPRTFVAGWLFVQEGCGNTYVYDGSHWEYAWTVYQVNREVVVVMLESFIFWVYRYRRSW